MKNKFIPDLSKQQALCEANYARIMKLMPDIHQDDEREFQVSLAGQESTVHLKVEERFTFTTTVIVRLSMSRRSEWLEAPQLQVRLYHDARLAEVICPQTRYQLKGKYPYPNKLMYQPDEKMQLNDYLAQWLSFCLNHGYQQQEVFTN